MGYAKYREDDIEISDERLHDKYPAQWINHAFDSETFICPYCSQIFDDKNSMFVHIKQRHSITRPLVIINDRVVPQSFDSCFETEIHSVVVIPYGNICTMKLDGIAFQYDQSANIVDITNEVCEIIKKKEACILEINSVPITIRLFTMNEIRSETVISIINGWQLDIRNRRDVTREYPVGLNPAERKYLDGFFNYFLACISSGKSKTDRYADAYGILSSFHSMNAIGRCVLKIIAFRTNSVERLRALCTDNSDDCFCRVLQFYDCIEANADNKKPTIYHSTESDGSIYMEDDACKSLDAILAFANGQIKFVDEYLSCIRNVAFISDVNLRDRIFLLMARRAVQKDDLIAARSYYSDILSPCFDRERARYINV